MKQLDYNKANEFHKKNTLKKFFRYKLMEIGIIPLSILLVWKFPLWIGTGTLKLLNINPETTYPFCKTTSEVASVTCIGGVEDIVIWFAGAVITLGLITFVIINWKVARTNSLEETIEKFKVDEKSMNELNEGTIF